MIEAKIIADSISPEGIRLTTMQLLYPRFVHSELMTHRVFSRNAASSRAIPIQKMIDQVHNNPAMPVFWGKNQAGMQAKEELTYFEPRRVEFFDGHRNQFDYETSPLDQAKEEWLQARLSAIKHAQNMVKIGVHKQIVNRLLEPWQEMQTIVTATEWTNFYKLRRHTDAQPEIKALADTMYYASATSYPRELNVGEWHLPYVYMYVDDAFLGDLPEMKKWSAARCARVSYLTHDKQDPDHKKDEDLHDKLLESGHFSPFEHQATPKSGKKMYANFKGWQSYRNQLGF